MRYLFGLLAIIASAFVMLQSTSCGYDYLDPIEIVIPDTVSFSNDIIPIFEESCNGSGCHATGAIAPDLTASNAWFELWIFGYIDTANAQSSILYEVMNSSSEPMPPNGKLPEDQVQLVLAWIEQGALDN